MGPKKKPSRVRRASNPNLQPHVAGAGAEYGTVRKTSGTVARKRSAVTLSPGGRKNKAAKSPRALISNQLDEDGVDVGEEQPGQSEPLGPSAETPSRSKKSNYNM